MAGTIPYGFPYGSLRFFSKNRKVKSIDITNYYIVPYGSYGFCRGEGAISFFAFPPSIIIPGF
jgi:hypothetical protein